jgi:cold shock CspA family protein
MVVKVRGNQTGSGVVKLWNALHRYGFIQRDDGDNDVFFDANAVNFAGLQDRMTKGLRVSFDLIPDGKGRRGCYAAVNLAATADDSVVDPAARILELENAIRQLYTALPEEARKQMRWVACLADIVDAEPTAAS